MPATITASMLYDLVQCPHRVEQDLFGDATNRDAISRFVQLLWDRGSAFEQQTIAQLRLPFVDLSSYSGVEKERRTREAIAQRQPLIYSGRLTEGDLVGEPDLLRLEGAGYLPGDIKSGSGEEGPDDRRSLKAHYAVQLALYVDVLEKAGLAAARRGFIWDVHGDEVAYDLAQSQGPRTPASWWDEYVATLESARRIANRLESTRPASASICKQCHWRSACLSKLRATNDLTLIPELGRSKRDALVDTIPSVRDLAAVDISGLVRGKKTVFAGIGPDTLLKLQRRAQLLCASNPQPYRTADFTFPTAERELFFDIEVDPMRDVCYLHGFIERTRGENATERYVAFFADHPTAEDEERAFTEAWSFVRSSRPCAIYYYSPYERTYWRSLRAKYPTVCSEAEVEALFADANTIDLYTAIVRRSTEWPTLDYSIKTLAKFLGFNWRDTEPSGAASIEWYHRWVESRARTLRARLLDYNEDDCRATRVLLDGLRKLPPGP
jgi:predicted RecB family nuclease